MKLNNPLKVSFDEVFKHYINSHKSTSLRNNKLFKYEIEVMKKADNFFSFWVKAKIYSRDISDLVLPYYIDNSSNYIVVPEQGERLESAYKRLFVKNKKDFRKNASFCFEKIMIQKKLIKKRDAGCFIFSQGPFVELDKSYNKSIFGNTDIVHLDGLHRLLALMDMPFKDRPNSIKSYIAARENFFEVFEK